MQPRVAIRILERSALLCNILGIAYDILDLKLPRALARDLCQPVPVQDRFQPDYRLFTLRKHHSVLRITGGRGFLRANMQ